MKIENGKIVEATEAELFDYWLERYSDIWSFYEYLFKMKKIGVIINECKTES